MKERPIIFSAPMVRAILSGTKTQTRRVLKNQRAYDLDKTPFGQPGDRIYVRETWNWFDPQEIPANRAGQRAPFTGQQGEREIPWVAAYAADGPLPYPGYGGKEHWRPSIHMPRWASRITLEITDVRVERLRDISEADAVAEGILRTPNSNTWMTDDRRYVSSNPVWVYSYIWEQINGFGSWVANPWVWVIEFERITSTKEAP